jgi:hypothetical protein
MKELYKDLMDLLGYSRGYPELTYEELVKLFNKLHDFVVQEVEQIIDER